MYMPDCDFIWFNNIMMCRPTAPPCVLLRTYIYDSTVGSPQGSLFLATSIFANKNNGRQHSQSVNTKQRKEVHLLVCKNIKQVLQLYTHKFSQLHRQTVAQTGKHIISHIIAW